MDRKVTGRRVDVMITAAAGQRVVSEQEAAPAAPPKRAGDRGVRVNPLAT